jgi:hypothetical protein
MRLVVIALLVGFVAPARADEVDELVKRGEALAKRGEFTTAIAAFKEADVKRPSASHACLIGLVYTRRELWPQAELFLAQCRARATADDPLPHWIETVERQLREKLEAAGAAPITIVVNPATAAAKITVSSFAPDEVFEPNTIHLAPGRHVLEVSAQGYVATSREVVVETAEPQTVTIELQKPEAGALRKVETPPPVPPAPARGRLPTALMIGGAALAVAGGAYQLFVYKPALDRLAAAPDDAVYDARVHSFRTRRDVTIGLYAGAALVLATGVVLRYTYDHHELTVSPAVSHEGASVVLGWSR